MAIYMKFGSINGGVTVPAFKNWIELHSFQLGASRAVTSGAGGRSREGSNPSISEVVVTKDFDAASSKLFQDGVAGHFDTKVEIKMTTTTKLGLETFLAFEFEKCGVASYSSSSGGDKPMESLSLNFLKIQITPSPLGHDGKPNKGDIVSYDLKDMKAS